MIRPLVDKEIEDLKAYDQIINHQQDRRSEKNIFNLTKSYIKI